MRDNMSLFRKCAQISTSAILWQQGMFTAGA